MSIDWTTLYETYKGLWIALLKDEQTVVGSGATAHEALEEAKKSGHEHPILTRMPEQLATYIGFGI